MTLTYLLSDMASQKFSYTTLSERYVTLASLFESLYLRSDQQLQNTTAKFFTFKCIQKVTDKTQKSDTIQYSLDVPNYYFQLISTLTGAILKSYNYFNLKLFWMLYSETEITGSGSRQEKCHCVVLLPSQTSCRLSATSIRTSLFKGLSAKHNVE